MGDPTEILRRVMRDTGTSQTALARYSGVHQPSISQFLHGKIDMSDEQLDRLLACMGYQLKIERSAVVPQLTRSERRSWLVHRAIAAELDRTSFAAWLPGIERNLERRRDGVRGEPHTRNVARWTRLVRERDLAQMQRALTGLDRTSIEMREVAPFAGVIADDVRVAALQAGG